MLRRDKAGSRMGSRDTCELTGKECESGKLMKYSRDL